MFKALKVGEELFCQEQEIGDNSLVCSGSEGQRSSDLSPRGGANQGVVSDLSISRIQEFQSQDSCKSLVEVQGDMFVFKALKVGEVFFFLFIIQIYYCLTIQ